MHTNRLAAETSPYLLQHQHNPVDWYPWGAEAFEAARAQNKPIFLSVGYSTCYWCHVMERQCFENESIAGVMNELFINMKVDREERPDVDSLYMTAVQVLTRQGGWPMSVFLTPDLRPFHGGTYFPPEDAYGRPGFPTLLRAIHDAWLHRRPEVEQAANQLSDILRQLAVAPLPKRPVRVDPEFIAQKISESTLDFDAVHGGFGGAPKFPRETLLELLLIDQRQAPNAKRMQMLRHTLDALANGGIRDHLGGGFHRYSTDRQWLVPHFEIMLYDNAMLAWCYVEAHRQTGEQRYARVARGILDFVLREMTSPDGAFYTAFDAEVDAQEGLNYLWRKEEIEAVLREGASDFCVVYGVSDGPNFVDPHHGGGEPDKNILYLPHGPERENDPLIVSARAKLYEARQQRKKPLLDTKILTSWNALMIRAFAWAGEILHEQSYINAASRAADYLLTMHRFPPSPNTPGDDRREGVAEASASAGLLRTSRDGQARYHAFLDDYAFFAQALLALHDATADPKWLREARNIVRQMQHRFGDEAGGFFYTDREASELLVRQKIATDSPLPAGNAVAAMVLTKLGELDEARKTLAAFTAQMDAHGEAMSSMLQAAMEFLQTDGPFTVSAAPSDAREDPASQVVRIQHQWIEPLSLILTLKIEPGFHLHAHEASAEFIGTDLFLYDEMSATIDYPPGEEKTFAFADRPIRVYEGEVRIAVRFAQPVVGKAIAMVLRYQACDASSCRAPVSQKFEVAVA